MSASHRHTYDSIPWLVNGRIGDTERLAAEKHLRECSECRADLAAQQRLHAALNAGESRLDYAPGASLQKLLARIGDEAPSAPATAKSGYRLPRPRAMQWLVAAVVVEAVGITLLAATMMQRSNNAMIAPPAYRTVTTTEIVPTNAVLRVVFAPTLTMSEMNALLRREHLEIVNGPSGVQGVYTLATTLAPNDVPQMLPDIVAELHAQKGAVLFAEPIARASDEKP